MPTSSEVELAKPAPAPPLVAMPTSSAEHSTGELDRHQPPPLTAASVVKRKRTKRPRHHPPAASSPASSSESTTTEEEDMAHCLILLAQGARAASGAHAAVDSKPSPSPSPALETQPPAPAPAATTPLPAVRSERYTSRKYTEAATTADGVKAGFYVYECKTCNKCFPTFQALGGHRASHKKPRLAGADDEIASNVTTAGAIKQQQPKPPAPTASGAAAAAPPLLLRPQIDVAVFPDVTTALSLNSGVAMSGGTAKLRVHECSICGAEFASGQALGGHMRRHRPLNAPERAVAAIAAAGDTKKEGSACINLELDLNLPAPSDEEAVSLAAAAAPAVMLGLGQFSDGKKAGLVLTASALVDCHY